MDTDNTISEQVETYITQATYLTDDDAPMVGLLRLLAKQIDGGESTAAMCNTFGVTLRALQKRKNPDAGPADEAEAFLESLA